MTTNPELTSVVFQLEAQKRQLEDKINEYGYTRSIVRFEKKNSKRILQHNGNRRAQDTFLSLSNKYIIVCRNIIQVTQRSRKVLAQVTFSTGFH